MPGASQQHWTFTVTGKTTTASWQSNPQLTAAVAGYGNYLDQNTEDALNAVRRQALPTRSKDLLTDLTAALQTKSISNTWHSTATSMYRNWLEFICAQRNASEGDAHVAAPYIMSR